MVALNSNEIRTREVLDWEGIHLLHAPMSSCSQKVRIALGLKRLAWHSHVIDVLGMENHGAWYLGINPRGLVPTMVLDGTVHIESNDILLVLERTFPDVPLFAPEQAAQISNLLRHEDHLHLDLRTVTFSFLITPSAPPKSQADLLAYGADGAGTVGGQPDSSKAREIAFWQQFLDGGIASEVACGSVMRFREAFDTLDRTLADQPYLLGGALSLLDIAWLVYANRLCLCGYPLARLHPHLSRWFDRLGALPEVARELAIPCEAAADFARHAEKMRQAGRALEQVCHL